MAKNPLVFPNDDDINRALSEDTTGFLVRTVERPDYRLMLDLVKAEFWQSAPVPKSSPIFDLWLEASLDLRETLKYLLPKDGLGKTILNPKNTRAEEKRVGKALDVLHDYLKLYAEVIEHPPPEVYPRVEQILRHRHSALKRINSPQP